MGNMSGRGLEDQSQSRLFWGEQKSGFKDFREGGINPAFILLTPILSSGLVVSCPLCRGCFSRCRESVIFSLWSSTLNGILFLFCREEARLDKTACGGGHPTATRLCMVNSPGQRCHPQLLLIQGEAKCHFLCCQWHKSRSSSDPNLTTLGLRVGCSPLWAAIHPPAQGPMVSGIDQMSRRCY